MKAKKSLLVAFAAFLALGVVALPAMEEPAVEPPKGLEESDPIAVGGDDDVTLSKQLIRTGGDGVTVTTNADVILSDCYIVAERVGIKVVGNGDVYLRNSFVQGGKAALAISGNGTLYASGSTIQGAVAVSGNGDFVDQGDNEILGKMTSTGAGGDAKVTIGEGGITVEGAEGTVTIDIDGDEIDIDIDEDDEDDEDGTP